MRHGGDWCNGPPYCNELPFAWGHQPDGYTYPDQLGHGGQAHLRYAQTMCDDRGWCKQLGQLGAAPYEPHWAQTLAIKAAIGASIGALGAYAAGGKKILTGAAVAGVATAAASELARLYLEI